MKSIVLIAFNTLRQTIRQRLFFNILIFGAGMLLLSIALANITFGYPERVIRSLGLSAINIALNLMALFVGIGLIHNEIADKTLFVLLVRPLPRWKYVVGRYLGLVSALALSLAALGVIFFAALMFVQGKPSLQDFTALMAMLPEAGILAGVGVIFSSFSTPILSAGMGLGVWIAGATSDDLVNLTAEADANTQMLAKAIYYVLPSFERLNFREFAIYQMEVSLANLSVACLYGAIYSAFLVGVAGVILSRREMV